MEKQVIVCLLLLFAYGSSQSTVSEPPCSLAESVPLNSHGKVQNGGHSFNDILIPKHLIFEVTDEATHEITMRGCICQIKSCLPLCRPILTETEPEEECEEDYSLPSEDYFIQTNENTVCPHGRLNTLSKDESSWQLASDGSLKLITNSDNTTSILPRGEFCFTPNLLNNDTNSIGGRFLPHVCVEDTSKSLILKIYGISFLIAEPFIMATIIVYVAIPKLHSLLGKCIICYLTSLSVSYLFKAYVLLADYPKDFHLSTKIGYLCVMVCLSTSLWSSVICFNLWFNLTTFTKFRNSRFLIYCAFCYGIPLIFFVSTFLSNYSILENSFRAKGIKPGVGAYCAVDVFAICIVVFNIIMFGLTWRKIKIVTADLKTAMDLTNSKRNLKNERNDFHLFVRLFVIMGILWLTDLMAHFAGKKFAHFFYFTDLLNIMQGVTIFLLFILKRNTRKLFRERFNELFVKDRGPSSVFYSKTTTSVDMYDDQQIQKNQEESKPSSSMV